MKKIVLTNFILESFDYNNMDHINIIKEFDNDIEIQKYIIASSNSFSEIIDYYKLYNTESIYNKLYLVRLYTGKIIGSVELDGDKNVYINYSIIKKYRGNGYCLNLLKEITKYLLNEIQKIFLLIKNDNVASKKLALKAGYNFLCTEGFNFDKYQISS